MEGWQLPRKKLAPSPSADSRGTYCRGTEQQSGSLPLPRPPEAACQRQPGGRAGQEQRDEPACPTPLDAASRRIRQGLEGRLPVPKPPLRQARPDAAWKRTPGGLVLLALQLLPDSAPPGAALQRTPDEVERQLGSHRSPSSPPGELGATRPTLGESKRWSWAWAWGGRRPAWGRQPASTHVVPPHP